MPAEDDMHRLINGALYFHEHEYRDHEQLFHELSGEQKPHTLFITCADSRIIPSMITHTRPGDLFILRNIANIVPPADRAEEFPSAVSTLLFAVEVLGVINIVVCGHSNCGGCSLLQDEEVLAESHPATRRWIGLASHVRPLVAAQPGSDRPGIRQWMTEQTNVIEQLKHLLTYPAVRKRFEEGILTLKGWYYRIDSGEVFQYDDESARFELLN
jgi:carbonic anhydrase